MRDRLLSVAEKIIKIDIELLKKSIGKLKKNSEDFIMKGICKSFNDENYDISFRLEPKIANDIPTKPPRIKEKNNFAIVMQGPIRKEENFTFNTVCYYKNIYPDAVIIVSTWDDEEKVRKSRGYNSFESETTI